MYLTLNSHIFSCIGFQVLIPSTWEIEGTADRTRTDEEASKEKNHEHMKKLREKRAMERNVEALDGDKEMLEC